MPPKEKKARKSASSAKQPEPLEHISQTRESAAKRFESTDESVNYDIEQNVREIRAILATNKEIFNRCIGSMKDVYAEDEDRVPYMLFDRVSFDNVKTIYTTSETTQFVIRPESSEGGFEMKALLEPPSGLEDIIAIKHMAAPHSMFIDYEVMFENILLLHENVLEPVLAKLKEHIMSVQVCLGAVEAWVMEPQKIIDFLEKTFGNKVDIPDDINASHVCDCPEGTHGKYAKCLLCEGHHHGRDGHTRTASGRFKCFRPNSSSSSYFHCNVPVAQVIKEIRNENGKHEASFNITEEKERKKLVKFLEFIEME